MSAAPEEKTDGLKRPWTKSHRKFDLGTTELLEEIKIEKVHLLPIPHMVDYAGDGAAEENMHHATSNALREKVTYRNLKGDRDCILGDIVRHPRLTPESRAYMRAGPRPHLWFSSPEVRAAVVTCGGLCPGLNNIVRHITLSLHNLYGAEAVIGVKNGYTGMTPGAPVLTLTPESVTGIHHLGGTVLGSSRGGFDAQRMLIWLREHRVNQLYIIGGDGTHRGAQKLFEAIREAALPIAVAGIPKTIDNDIDMVDRSFGFNTAVEEAQAAIRSAKVEASCAPNGVGVVKVMGRHAGFIAAHATLASGDVDLCLVPEVPVVLRGARGCLPHVARAVRAKGHAVVVVAEGAGEELIAAGAGVDASGNRKLPPIAELVREELAAFLAEEGLDPTIKYIDPSYMIRSVPANASDSLFCMLLAQNAVHGAMAGFTGFVTALCNNRTVYLPITEVVANSPRSMDPFGRTWERVLSVTGQPDTADRLKPRPDGKGAITAKTVF